MIRISASDLEGFRYWKGREDSSLEELIARLSHAEPPTRQMEAGRAFAKLMETASDGVVDIATVDGWTFDFSDLDAAPLVRAPYREIKGEKVYATPHGPVTLVCKTDGLDGRRIHDQKLTERWDAEKYLDSLQWRAYLDIFDAHAFVYDVFVGRYARGFYGGNDYDSPLPDDPQQCVNVVEYHPMTFYRYPNLAADVERAVSELAGVIKQYVPGLVTPDAQSA